MELHLSTAKPGVTPFHHISKMGETLYPVLLLRAVVQPEARRGRQNRLTVMRNELSRPNYLNWPEERGASLLTHVDRTIHPPCVCLHCPNLGFFFDFFFRSNLGTFTISTQFRWTQFFFFTTINTARLYSKNLHGLIWTLFVSTCSSDPIIITD